MNLSVQKDILPKNLFPWEPNPHSALNAKKKPEKSSPPAHSSLKVVDGTQTVIHPQRPKVPKNQKNRKQLKQHFRRRYR